MTPLEAKRAAPLAQLREVDEDVWHQVMAQTNTSDGKQQETAQIIAATFLGDIDLALEISQVGFYTRAMTKWPDLVTDNPRTKTKEDA